MPLVDRSILCVTPLRALFLTAFWVVSALAFFLRLERFSLTFSVITSGLLGLGLGAVLVTLSEPLERSRRTAS